MNSKSVLNRILTLLSLESEVVEFTDAKTADGTILQSPTFDLGETVEVVSEDGTKMPAPDGEYEIGLKDSEGKDVIIKVEVKDGKIDSRENVEEANPEVGDTVMPETEMAKEDVSVEEAKSLPNTTDEDIRNSLGEDTDEEKDPVIRLSYRIDEMEKQLKSLMEKMQSAAPEEGQEVSSLTPNPSLEMEEVDEEELPKLDGAPLEAKFGVIDLSKTNFGKKPTNSQDSFLSKLYN